MKELLTQLSIICLGVGLIAAGFVFAEAEDRLTELEKHVQGIETLIGTIDPIQPVFDVEEVR